MRSVFSRLLSENDPCHQVAIAEQLQKQEKLQTRMAVIAAKPAGAADVDDNATKTVEAVRARPPSSLAFLMNRTQWKAKQKALATELEAAAAPLRKQREERRARLRALIAMVGS
jgi:hypothetical protein